MMAESTPRKVVRILGVPMDLGQQRRGVDMGPSAVRYAGLQERITHLGYDVIDNGNLIVPVVEAIADGADDPHAHHLAAVTQVCQNLYERSIECMTTSDFSIFLGGDHSMSVGSVAGVSSLYNIGVLWVDAHADYNTPQTTPSGNVHGMPVAAILGDEPASLANLGKPDRKLHPSQMAMIGIRDLDSAERDRLSDSGITVHTMSDIDEHGIASLTRQLIDHFRHLDAIHVSLDMDSLDPDFAPGVGTPVPGGLTYREAHLLMELLAASGKVRSMDIVEINPILDNHNRTAELAVELAASLLGQRIL